MTLDATIARLDPHFGLRQGPSDVDPDGIVAAAKDSDALLFLQGAGSPNVAKAIADARGESVEFLGTPTPERLMAAVDDRRVRTVVFQGDLRPASDAYLALVEHLRAVQLADEAPPETAAESKPETDPTKFIFNTRDPSFRITLAQDLGLPTLLAPPEIGGFPMSGTERDWLVTVDESIADTLPNAAAARGQALAKVLDSRGLLSMLGAKGSLDFNDKGQLVFRCVGPPEARDNKNDVDKIIEYVRTAPGLEAYRDVEVVAKRLSSYAEELTLNAKQEIDSNLERAGVPYYVLAPFHEDHDADLTLFVPSGIGRATRRALAEALREPDATLPLTLKVRVTPPADELWLKIADRVQETGEAAPPANPRLDPLRRLLRTMQRR
jgi:hypothetical protein